MAAVDGFAPIPALDVPHAITGGNMTELRKDPIVGRWVIISKERGRRPHEYPQMKVDRHEGFCPLCPGSERMTPPQNPPHTRGAGGGGGGGWTLRVVPNKFPALRIEGDLGKAGEGIYDKMNGIGAHEVVIETERHDIDFFDLPEERVADVLRAYRERTLDLKKDQRFKSVIIFKNHGSAAGASLTHSHSQLIALPVVPKVGMEEMTGCRDHFRFRGPGPYAPGFPFETWIVPKRHQCAYEMIEEEQIRALSAIFRRTLRKLNLALEDPPFNYIVHSAAFQAGASEFFHWHIEIMPRLTKVAGFERGSGFYINPTPPEEAAKFLRELPG